MENQITQKTKDILKAQCLNISQQTCVSIGLFEGCKNPEERAEILSKEAKAYYKKLNESNFHAW